MKRKILLTVVLLISTLCSFADGPTTRFLGIPVDGAKSEMIQQLLNRGYKYHQTGDYLTGFYFGNPVYVFVQTVNDKVSRVIVYDIEQKSESEIKKRFNYLFRVFSDSDRFKRLGKKNVILTEEDDLLYKMRQYNYVHKAVFRQIKEATTTDIHFSDATVKPKKHKPINTAVLEESYMERRRRIHARAIGYVNQHNKDSYKNQVWFAITEKFGKFAIVMLYDNVENLLQERPSYDRNW